MIGPAGQQVTAPGANLQAAGSLPAGIRADSPYAAVQGTARPEQADLQSSLQDLTDQVPAQPEADKFKSNNELPGRENADGDFEGMFGTDARGASAQKQG